MPEAFGANLRSAYHTLADVLDGLGHAENAAQLRRQLDATADNNDSDGEPT